VVAAQKSMGFESGLLDRVLEENQSTARATLLNRQ
jgi:hypothetical protein